MSLERGGLERRGPHRVLVVIAIIGCLQAFFLLAVEFDRTLVHRREIARLSSEVAVLEAEIEELSQVAAHAADPVYREALARGLGFVYPHEQLIVTDRR